MPARAGNTVFVPGKGAYTTKPSGKHVFTGKGPAPKGAKKVAEKSYAEVPIVTTSPSGEITTSGFTSSKTAKRARRKQQTAIRTERRKTRALNLTRRSKALQQRKTSQSEASLKRTEQTVRQPRKTTPAPKLAPSSKPAVFQGKKTAGAPSLKELRVANKRGALKTNQRGYLTTPAVRNAASTVKRIESRASTRRSRAPLPGLDPEQAKVARTVLRQGEKARATSKEKLAAVETGLTESSLRNLSYGDADSQGWRQERTSIYGTGPKGPTNVPASAHRFFREVKTDAGTSSAPTPGLLAQAAQGSAFPERYDERAPEAKAILRAYNKGKLKPSERHELAAAKAQAQKLGLKGLTKSKSQVSKQVLTRFKVAKKAAAELTKAKIPYVWGGGHGGFTNPRAGLDCSGAVSYVLHKMGVLSSPLTSGDMGSALKPGPGAVTVFYNPEHTFMRIGNQYWGTSVGDSGAGGLGPHPTPSASYLAQYNVGHVAGLGKKVAVALGIPLTGGGSFPGMALSPSGTTATIESGTTNSGKPGFSSKPIRLTQAQKARRTFKRLQQVGVGDTQPAEEASTSSTLAGLERKYGVKTG